MSKVIEAIKVCKTFGEQRVSKSIDLAVEQGSIYGLLGPNGAGKTTLIRMLSTITQPDSGEILFKGEALKESHAHQMGYMPEERGLYKNDRRRSAPVFCGVAWFEYQGCEGLREALAAAIGYDGLGKEKGGRDKQRNGAKSAIRFLCVAQSATVNSR